MRNRSVGVPSSDDLAVLRPKCSKEDEAAEEEEKIARVVAFASAFCRQAGRLADWLAGQTRGKQEIG